MARLSVAIVFMLALAAIAQTGTAQTLVCADGELCTYLPSVQGGASTPQPTAVPATPTRDPAICDPSYPTVCIPPPPPDLDCGDIPYRYFTVLPPDPHWFDRDNDGIGCESG